MEIIQTSLNSDFIYFINKDKREVTAVLRHTKYLLAQYINKYCPNITMTGDTVLKPYYMGKAYCHPFDIWDVEKGMEIAKKRALNKYHKERARLLSDWLYKMENQMAPLFATEAKWTARLFEDDFGV